MNIHCRISKPEIALRARLFVPGWQLQYLLKNSTWCVIAFDGDKAIGVMVYDMNDHRANVMAFVRSQYRRQGVGSRMFTLLKRNVYNTDFKAVEGVYGSRFFWRSKGIKCSKKFTDNFED